MSKAPDKLPCVGDSVQLRGRPQFVGILRIVNPLNNWARIDWRCEKPGPLICHLHELEKATP